VFSRLDLPAAIQSTERVVARADIRRHPRNTQFEWTPVPRLGGALTPAQADQLDRDGYVLVQGVLDPDELAEVTAALDEYEAKVTRWLDARGGTMGISDAAKITFAIHAVTRYEVVNRFARSEIFARLALDLLGADVRLYWDQAVYKKPEPEREFPWHQDTGYTFVEPQHYLTCWIPLTPATRQNGCPEVAVGYHRYGTLEHVWVDPTGWQCLQHPETSAVVEAAVGDVICFSSLTPHRTGPNRTEHVRKAYILQYALDGSVVTPGAGDDDATAGRQEDPDRQFPIVVDGRPLGAQGRL